MLYPQPNNYDPGPELRGREDVDDAARDQLLRLRAVGGHVRRRGVRLERLQALPLLDHQERVVAALLLERSRRIGVDRGAVLDAALLGVDAGHVGAEGGEDLGAPAG